MWAFTPSFEDNGFDKSSLPAPPASILLVNKTGPGYVRLPDPLYTPLDVASAHHMLLCLDKLVYTEHCTMEGQQLKRHWGALR